VITSGFGIETPYRGSDGVGTGVRESARCWQTMKPSGNEPSIK
jgi:hypothetical protein